MKEPRTPIMAAIDLLNGVSPYDDVEHAKEVVISSLKSIMSDISFLHARMPEQEYGIVHGSVRRELARQNKASEMSHYSVLWAMDRNELHSQINRMYEQGYRVLSVVYSAHESPTGYTVVYEVREKEEEKKPPFDTSWMRTPSP